MDADQKEKTKDSNSNDNSEEGNEQNERPADVAPATTREENPFSFRHFLRRSQQQPPSSQPEQHRLLEEEYEANRFGGARPKTNSRASRNSIENELKSPCGLPDFVQDHLVVEHELSSSSHLNGYHIPNHSFDNGPVPVDSPLDLPRSHSPIHAAGAMPIPLDIANLASSHPENNIPLGTLDIANLNSSVIDDLQPPQEPAIPGAAQAHEINNNENVNSLSQLPDFLSDGPMQSGRINQEILEPSPGSQPSSSSNAIMEENARLRQQLELAVANEQRAMTRIAQLESLLEEQRRRETEETSSLEKSMEQIEENLKSATQRAVQSENQVVQLKKDNRRLQDEIKRLQEALCAQHNNETSLRQPRDLNQTAQELYSAASSAERSIRDLLAGVEHLRVMAASLESMERIEEVRPKRERDRQT